jgi:hypothetical protein
MGSPCKSLYGILMVMARYILSMRVRRKRSPSAGIPELDEIVLAARHEKAHCWMPLNTLDVPSMASRDTFLAALRKGPNAHGRVVTCGGEAVIVGQKLCPHSASRCAGHAVRLFMLGWKYLTIPVWSADAI